MEEDDKKVLDACGEDDMDDDLPFESGFMSQPAARAA